MKKCALISGVSGQDGAYLAKFLLEKGYRVVGTSRDVSSRNFEKLERLGIRDKVSLRSMVLGDFRSVLTTLTDECPDEIYNLAGQSSVGLSFEQPVETMESIANACLNLLESIRFLGTGAKLYNAGSSECFGDTGQTHADEMTAFRPRSPYAVAKAAGHWAVSNYREAYSLFACNGILFNHESPLRPDRFVTKKIVSGAYAVKQGRMSSLTLGNLDISRDWGFAPEYVEAMWGMLQLEHAQDFVIATGQTNSLKDFVMEAFKSVDLDWKDHVVISETLKRPSEIMYSSADPSKAKEQLGWTARKTMRDVVHIMVKDEMTKWS